MRFLIDTDWAIHYLNAHPGVVQRLAELQDDDLALSLISLAELYEGVFSSRDPEGDDGDCHVTLIRSIHSFWACADEVLNRCSDLALECLIEAGGRQVRYVVTGCAGFIGSHLVDRLLQDGHEVTGYDNFATGQPEFLVQAQQSSHFRLQQGDLLDVECLTQAMRGADLVCHLAANADVRFGTQHPRKDLEHNTIATFNVLEAMRANDIRRLAFSSTGSVYGEPDVFPTPETCPFPTQTSLYGASKVASERGAPLPRSGMAGP